MDVLGGAVRLAAQRPESPVPCPGCGVSPKGKSFARHLDKHPGVVVGTAWRSSRRTLRHPRRLTLSVEDDVVRLGRRRVRPESVAIGGLTTSRPDGIMTGYDDVGYGTVEEPTGTYLAVGGLVVRCDTGTDVRKNWTGWVQGERRKRWDVTVGAADFVAFQYALAELGLLQPR